MFRSVLLLGCLFVFNGNIKLHNSTRGSFRSLRKWKEFSHFYRNKYVLISYFNECRFNDIPQIHRWLNYSGFTMTDLASYREVPSSICERPNMYCCPHRLLVQNLNWSGKKCLVGHHSKPTIVTASSGEGIPNVDLEDLILDKCCINSQTTKLNILYLVAWRTIFYLSFAMKLANHYMGEEK